MKKYKTWEIVVALLPILFAIDGIWHSYFMADEYPSALYHIVKHVITFTYIAIFIYSIYCMYRGAEQTGRFPKLMLVLLIATVADELFGFVSRFLPQGPTEDFQVPAQYYIYGILALFYTVVMIIAIVRMYMAKINVLAITLTCMVVALPLLQSLIFRLMATSLSNGPTADLTIVGQVFSFLFSLCYSVVFLRRNDFYKIETE